MKLLSFLVSVIFLLSFKSFAQKEKLSKDLQERYYSENINVGKVDSRLFDSLKNLMKAHPSKFYETCGSFYKEGMMNEAAVLYIIGRSRYAFYNETNPKYEASGDGALAGSLAGMFGENIIFHLNQNIDNYSELLKISAEWYRENEYFYFNDSKNSSLYKEQTKGLLDFADELKNNPEDFINNLEQERIEMEELIDQLDREMEEEFEKGEYTDEEYSEDNVIAESGKKPTINVPQAFFVNYNCDHFVFGEENEISAVAHGYYDTYLESNDAEIIQSETNSLQYIVKPYKKGECVIRLYGVSEKGIKASLAVYTYSVR